MEHSWNDTDKENEVFRETPVPAPRFPPQIADYWPGIEPGPQRRGAGG
jgi:hypothetical protein